MWCWPSGPLPRRTDICWAEASNKFINLINTERERREREHLSRQFPDCSHRAPRGGIITDCEARRLPTLCLFSLLLLQSCLCRTEGTERERERERERGTFSHLGQADTLVAVLCSPLIFQIHPAIEEYTEQEIKQNTFHPQIFISNCRGLT